ncbi:TPA: hypothetical protein LUC54_000608 [Acinetobacter baumannii]|uniref:Uncharacterized protein n=3 Tax=Acinetobacter baumannii TaxID=470 RepID=A0ABX6CHW4_ACIB2|nr:hypothetical protein [Acinetobacter baumannii]ARN30168.1 hypothetical protein A4U85_05420 [Acinetobacter baumannii]EEX03331.1 hypothetical protein HMPREF0010_02373 [Acinetobacter baumannii ATCC 19606 = CIP 70.34 = JCM 6841]EME53671.1 hypothetical protein G347_16815 [Acinetobacter baumannii MSP4-16]ENW76032.1 hypothetical protein F911_01316 [Acinetobacter baumannii ATCC 19606 = CIP 70.34 = JCM 6841]KFC03110.1 hypothetical protein DJ41_1793 [Acinetobacter baumannii ATCC 19606 = CIP 70.34 = JC
MTDLNKGRELEAQIEVFKKETMELWFVPDLADTYKNKDLFSYSIMDGEVFFMREQARQLWSFWNKAKAQAVPEKKIYLTCEQLYAAANFGAPNKDPELLETELTIAWFEEAHSGSGYYVYISEYPEEGAMKLESESGAEG